MENKWHIRFLKLAQFISGWSKDPSSKIGAVIVDKTNRIISTGYNGFAIGVQDTQDRLENREIKYPIILHAEENAILFAKQNLESCSLYVSGLPPCAHCASIIIQTGIKNVYSFDMPIPERWQKSFELTKQMFEEAGVTLTFIKVEE
jgi:dCMP deaminase